MKTDDQKDEYAQRVNHEKEDRGALLRRLKDLSGYLDTHAENTYWPESWHRDAQLIKDTIARLTAPSGCPSQGETPRTDAEEADNHGGTQDLWVSADFARQLERELDALKIENTRAHGMIHRLERDLATANNAFELAAKQLKGTPRPSPSPAGGADGERLDWLESELRHEGQLNISMNEQGTHLDADFSSGSAIGTSLRELIGDAKWREQNRAEMRHRATIAAAQATPAKEGK